MKKFFIKLKAALPKERKTRVVLAILITLGLAGAVALGSFVSNFVAGMTIVNLPGVPVVNSDSTPYPDATTGVEVTATPDTQSLVELPEPWDGKSRVSVLVMGLDARDLEDYKAPRTDSMILFTMDPVNMTAGLISIPRDLWVKIPDGDYEKINTAYSVGELYKLPGGGPALAVRTVEDLLGVPIQYYAQIDFKAFVSFIDHIKGVTVTVKERIQLDVVNTKTSMWLKPGTYTLPGDLALAYVRARHTSGGDFDRAGRQQEVIMSIKERVLKFDMMPTLIANSNELYADLSSGINTNLSPSEAIRFALKVLEIPSEKIMHKVIDNTYVNFGKSPEGLDILRPIPDRIRELRDEVFYGLETASTSSGQDLQATLQDEHASVSVRNGSSDVELLARTAEYLRGQGINVVEETTTDYQMYSRITLFGSKPYTLKYLVENFKIAGSAKISYAYDPNAPIDIVLELGDDWARDNPLP